MSVRAVVFDLGNVLIRWDPQPAVARGVGVDEATRFLTASDFDFSAWNHQQDAGRSWDEAQAYVQNGFPHWAEHARAYRTFFASSLLGPIDGTVSIAEELHAAGVPLFALTNWSCELFPAARERFAFLRLFDDIVVSGQEGVAKPAPEIFGILARRVGLPLETCVFVDDSPGNVEAGSAAGLDALQFSDPASLRVALRDRGLPV